MDRKFHLPGRTAATPTAIAAPHSNDKDLKRSMLDPFKRFKGAYVSKLIRSSQAKALLSRLKGLKEVSKTSETSDFFDLKTPSPFVKSVASTWSTTSSQLLSARALSWKPDSLPTAPDSMSRPQVDLESASSALHPFKDSMPLLDSYPASQKRKQDEEHDDAPSRMKTKPGGNDYQKWVDEQEASGSPRSTELPRQDDVNGLMAIDAEANTTSAQLQGQAQDMPPPPTRQLTDPERRGSTATTSNSINRESIFSTCTSNGTAMTNSSELSLANNYWRRNTAESRTNSFFSKTNPSPRSSIASSAPSPSPAPLTCQPSSWTSNGFVEESDLSKHPLPIPALPLFDPLASRPVQTVLGIDILNRNNAVTMDQMVKRGHIAQERRFSHKTLGDNPIALYEQSIKPDLAKAVAIPCTLTENLAPIKETASDDGASTIPKALREATDGASETASEAMSDTTATDMLRTHGPVTAQIVTDTVHFGPDLRDMHHPIEYRYVYSDSGYDSISDGWRGSTAGKNPARRKLESVSQPAVPTGSALTPVDMSYNPLTKELTHMYTSHLLWEQDHHIVNDRAGDKLLIELETLQSQVGAQNEGCRPCVAFNLEVSTPPPVTSGTVCRSNPDSPRSGDRQSDTVATDGPTPQGPALTPATSVADVSEITEVLSPFNEDSDDDASEFTDYTEESLFEAIETFDPILFNPLMLSIIVAFNEDVLHLVLARIDNVLGNNNGHGTLQHHPGESTPSGSSSNVSSQGQGPDGPRRTGQKRPANNDGDGGSKENDGNERGKRPRPPTKEPSGPSQRYKKLACPFYKRYPGIKWNGKSCYGPGYPTVHRLKEHVYRNHDIPYCERCHATFANPKALKDHRRIPKSCTVNNGPLSHHGITPEQRAQLKSKKKTTGEQNFTEEDKWAKVYLLLFPDVLKPDIPSPYYDLQSCEELLTPEAATAFRLFLQEDVPVRVTRQLEDLQLGPGLQRDFFQNQLPDIIRDCLGEALDSVPTRLLAVDGHVTPSQEPGEQSHQPSMSDPPESQIMALIGAQFAAVEPQAVQEPVVLGNETLAGDVVGNSRGLPIGYGPADSQVHNRIHHQVAIATSNRTNNQRNSQVNSATNNRSHSHQFNQTYNQLPNQVHHPVPNQVHRQMQNQVYNQTSPIHNQVPNQVQHPVYSQVHRQMQNQVYNQTSPMYNQINNQMNNQTNMSMGDNDVQSSYISTAEPWLLRRGGLQNPLHDSRFYNPPGNNLNPGFPNNMGQTIPNPPPSASPYTAVAQPGVMLTTSHPPTPSSNSMVFNGTSPAGLGGFQFDFETSNMPYNMPNAPFLHDTEPSPTPTGNGMAQDSEQHMAWK